MKCRDWIFLSLLLVSAFAFLFPWQLNFNERAWTQNYHNVLAIALVSSILHMAWRIIRISGQPKLAKRSAFGLGVIFCLILLYANLFIGTPHLSTYMLLYTNPNNEHETIAIVHYHRFLDNHNELERIIRYPSQSLSLRKTFKQDHLNGEWIVNEGNPYCELSGKVLFENGIAIRPAK